MMTTNKLYVCAANFMVREDIATNAKGGVSAKFVYYVPPVCRALMNADRDGRVKIVCAGIKGSRLLFLLLCTVTATFAY